jgi:tetratricopeptide (TPR) repeat protein
MAPWNPGAIAEIVAVWMPSAIASSIAAIANVADEAPAGIFTVSGTEATPGALDESDTTRSVAVLPLRLYLLCLVVAASGGCRLVSRRNPVPAELADARRLCNEGLSAADRQDLVRAESLLKAAVKSCPVDVDARRHYADVLWRRGEKMEAVTQISEALELSPGEEALCLDGGRMYMELGLLDDADRLADEAVAVAPGSAAAWHLRGQVALARGRAEEALADFHRALAIAPDDRDALLDTAEVYRRLGRPQRCLATLAILGETYGPNQTPPHVLTLEGIAQEALGRPLDALASYRQAVARGGSTPDLEARMAALAAPAADGTGVIRR